MKKNILFAALLLLIQGGLFAQITLTQNDVGPIGSVFYLGIDDSIGTGISIGAAGANQAWDFSSLDIDDLDTVWFIDPASTPYGSDFPTSNLCIQQASLAGGFVYLVSSTSSLEIIGIAADPADLGQTFVIPQDPSLTVASFPFTYGDVFQDTAKINLTIDAAPFNQPFVDSIRIQSVSERTLEGDAWGDLTLYAGTYNTLRVKDITNTADSIWVLTFGFWTLAQDSMYTDSSFTWWDDNSGYLLCEADYSGGNLDQITYQNPNVVSATPQQEALSHVYPNPTSDQLIVTQKGRAYTNIEILDLQGRVLRNMPLHGIQDKISVADLIPGIYLYRLTGKAHSKAGKLQILR